MSDLIKQTEKLQKIYSEETLAAKKEFVEKTEKLYRKIKEVKSTDYLEEYAETYKVSLAALNEIYEDWASVQRRTKGLGFHIYDYKKTVKPRVVPAGGAFGYVDRLVEEGRTAIAAVQQSTNVEDDIEPQKAFCQALCDLEYVVENSTRLLEETNVREESLRENLEPLEAALKKANDEYDKKTKIENLKCYDDLMQLKNQILVDAKRSEDSLIGSPITDDECDYRFLIGFKKTKISKEALKFAKEVLDVPEKYLSGTPVFFEPKTRNGVIFVKADGKLFKRSKTSIYGDKLGIMRNFYFSLVSQLKPVNLKLCCAETSFAADLKALTDSVRNQLGEGCLFCGGIAKNSDECRRLLEKLQNFSSDHLSEYMSAAGETGKDIQNIYEFNEEKPDGKQGFVLAMFNYMPDCMDVDRGNDLEILKDILTSGPSMGIYSLVRIDNTKDFDLSDIDADILEIADDYSVTFNGEPVSVDIEKEGFIPVDFYKEMKESLKSGDSLSLKKLLTESEKRFESKPIAKYNDALQIPLGMSNGAWYDFTIKTCSPSVFGLFTGSTGSGKSVTLHSFILSASYFYAPDELELYLVDFKTSGESPDFAAYKKGSPLYVPHVKYLSLKNAPESAMDLLNKIEFMINKRAECGYRDMRAYNQSEEVKTGKKKKMPIALFLVDEYNQMFKNVNDDIMMANALKSKLANIVKVGRSYGIEIIFFGQDVSSSINDSLGQMGLRMSLKVNEERVLTDLFKFKDSFREVSDAMDKLSRIGTALVSTDGGKEKSFVKLAYCGEPGGKQTLEIAEKIREKFKDNPACKDVQTVAGSDEKFDIGEFEKIGAEIDKYYFPIGVSAANTLPVCLEYSLEKSTAGYIAYSNDEAKLFEIERSAMLSFMYKYPGKGNVVYCSNLVDNASFFKGFEGNEELLRSSVKECSDRYSIACEAEKLYKIFEERTEEAEVSDKEFPPIFFVLHDFEWLMQRGKITPPKETEETEEKALPAKSTSPSKETEKGLEALKSSGILGGAAAGLLGAALSAPINPPKKKTEYKEFRTEDVREIVTTLFEKGNRVGIFVLLSNETESAVSEILRADTSEAKPFASHVVYGSYGLKTKGKEDGSKNCVFVSTINSRARLFDYSEERNAGWWKKFRAERK